MPIFVVIYDLWQADVTFKVIYLLGLLTFKELSTIIILMQWHEQKNLTSDQGPTCLFCISQVAM